MKRKKLWTSGIYLTITLGMMLYALPRLQLRLDATTDGSGAAAVVFAFVWLGFGVLVASALLYRLLRVDEARDRELARIRLHKWQRWQQTLLARAATHEPGRSRGRVRDRG